MIMLATHKKYSGIAIAGLFCVVLLSGCAATQEQAQTETSNTSLSQPQLEQIIQQQESILVALKSQPKATDEQEKRLEAMANTALDGKTILGQEEWLWFEDLQDSYKTRVDTGAATSSLNATEIVNFERDGEDWVKFNLAHMDNTKLELESKVVRISKIRQSSSTTEVKRYVISLPVQLGNIRTKTEFTLADRNHMSFPVLLGRTFIKDIAIVDVAQKYTQEKKQPETKVKAKTAKTE